jgi:ribosomal-protein-alanine N-acetyltransferase
VRPFLPPDLDVATALVGETFQELFAPQMYLTVQDAWPAGQLVMEEGGQLVGLLIAIKRSRTSARILIMVVRPELRSRSLGSELLRHFLRQCTVEGITNVTLEVRRSNTRAFSFYSRYGFNSVGLLTHYYRDGEDGIVMSRDLV